MMNLGFETMFLIGVAVIAMLIMVATAIGALLALRGSKSNESQETPQSAVETRTTPLEDVSEESDDVEMQPTYAPTPMEDIEAYLSNQRAQLTEFELKDVSTSFRGTTNDNQRKGVVVRVDDPDTPLIAFTSQAFNPQSGTVTAETAYGKMELIVTQGRAGVQWEGEPLGILDYSKQRILGAEGQLLGSLERPSTEAGNVGNYPIGFFGQKAADISTTINALSTLRWFSSEDTEHQAAFSDIAPDLEDQQTLLLLATLMLEIGFFDVL